MTAVGREGQVAGHLDRVRAFRTASFEVADGYATRRVVEELVLPALG